MSFSSSVKEELCKTPVCDKCCAGAEAYGILLYGNTFDFRAVRIITGNPGFAKRIPKIFKHAFDIEFDSVPSAPGSGKRVFAISDRSKISAVFDAFGYDTGNTLAHHINFGVLENACCKKSFVRGAFLAGGSVADPEKRYHLEFVTDHMSVSREAYSLLLEMDFFPKDTARAGNYITYFKQSEEIEDLLTSIGAPLSAMKIMSAKVEKDMRNTVNRRVNCDSANADKVVMAAARQLDVIKRIERGAGIGNLPDKLREAALLRIANPEASLEEMALLSDPPVSKSCLNHRLRKLATYSDGDI
ncbi:MAG: DNA-binding protein WhiA [Oscillospiraceae bacterium]|nr:DNA-binding protein WhiA [Oscillospiraceae bacterium]